MNGQIIRYLALNGPLLIYSIAKDLASRSQTKVHYPTVNRRVHELLRRDYLQKAGTRMTKAGVPADLYSTTIRGDFAALAGMRDDDGEHKTMSPKELCQVITIASHREGSPFLLLAYIRRDSQSGVELVDKELMPEIVNGVRNGYLNLEALDEGVVSSAFASLVSRKITAVMANLGQDRSAASREKHRGYIDILMRSLEKTMDPAGHKVGKASGVQEDRTSGELQIKPVSTKWGTELKVFLKLHSVMFD